MGTEVHKKAPAKKKVLNMKAATSSKRPYASTKLHGAKNHTSYL